MTDAVNPLEPAAASRSRGRPRNLQSRQAILQAARELLEQAGPSGVTMEAVAARAGVGKPTVYRWWPDRHAVAMAALMEDQPVRPPSRPLKSPLQALSRQLLGIVDTLSSATGRNVASMISAADPHTELSKAFRNHFVLARREEGRVLLSEAQRAGLVRHGIDLEVALDLVYGPLFFRLLLGHAGLDADFVKQLLATALRGIAEVPAGRPRP